MKTTETQVAIKSDGNTLYGMLHLPEAVRGERYPVVVICHGFIGNKNGQHSIFVKTARALSAEGFAALRFDFSGCGESSGHHRDITLTRQVAETISAIDFAAAHPSVDPGRIIILGHSLGGAIAATVAGLDSRISGLALWSPVARPVEDLVGVMGFDFYNRCITDGQMEYQGFEIGGGFMESLYLVSPLDTVKRFDGDALVAHGDRDAEVPMSNAYLYGGALNSRRRGSCLIRIIGGADHTFASPVWERDVIGKTLQWLAPGRKERHMASPARAGLVCRYGNV
jgi:dipeptidyl aminopeptidase/acylaminoacyl peptidase